MTITLGVLADTHIPDRVRQLNPQVLAVFREAKVNAILHAGDISSLRVLDHLRQIAPVYAVRGNRDWLWLRHLPTERLLRFEDTLIALTHGHGGWRTYLLDRAHYIMNGVSVQPFTRRLPATYPQARVIIFGHIHRPVNQWINGRLLFNPGSPHFPDITSIAPSVGLLHLQAGGDVLGEIIPL
jgi:putative phosphoesterase